MSVKRCNKCNSIVFKSELPDYSYQCFNHDEDLYSFEVYDDGIVTDDALLEELYSYTVKEYNDELLSEKQKNRYVNIVNVLKAKGVEIPFGIEI